MRATALLEKLGQNESTRARSVCNFTKKMISNYDIMLAIESGTFWNLVFAALYYEMITFWRQCLTYASQFKEVPCMILCNWNSASFNQSSKWWCNPQRIFTKTTFCKKIGPVVSPKTVWRIWGGQKIVPLKGISLAPGCTHYETHGSLLPHGPHAKIAPLFGCRARPARYGETQFPIDLWHDMCAIDI